jgi:antitoxin YefM
MESVNYTAARASLAKLMDEVNDDRRPVLVTRQRGRPVVMMSLEEYNALEETAHLLRSPANAERLLDAIAQLRSGGGQERQLADADQVG